MTLLPFSRLVPTPAVLCVICCLCTFALADPLPYEEPNFGKPLFGQDSEELSDLVSSDLFTALMQIVEHPEIDAETRGEAMLLAYHLCGAEWKTRVILRDYELRYDKPFATTYLQSAGSAQSLAPGLEKAMLRIFPKELITLPADPNQGTQHYSGKPPEDPYAPTYFLASLFEKLEHWGDPSWAAQIEPSWPVAYGESPSSKSGRATSGDNFAKRQSLVKGLLVVRLQGAYAGQASQMNASVLPKGLASEELAFNQPVGPDMTEALNRVLAFSANRHRPIPSGQRVELSFEEQYSLKDGPSASVACALLMDSLWTGETLETQFAVTGDMLPDGTVEPVGGISGKIRGAAARNCTHVAIPSVNIDSLLDILIVEGLEPLCKVQVFTIDTFEEAKELALQASGRSDTTNQSLELFATVAELLQRSDYAETTLRNAKVQERLREVVELTPNHASAKVLLLKAIGREPERLTVEGSLDAIDRAAVPLFQGLRETKFGQNGRPQGGLMESHTFRDAAYNLRRIRHKLDDRTWKCVDAMTEFSTLLRKLKNEPPESVNRYNQLVDEINAAGRQINEEYEQIYRTLQLEQRAEEAKRKLEREAARAKE